MTENEMQYVNVYIFLGPVIDIDAGRETPGAKCVIIQNKYSNVKYKDLVTREFQENNPPEFHWLGLS